MRTPVETAHPSPNHDDRDGHAVCLIVLHYTGMRTGAEALERLCDPAAKVSAHYLVEEDGRIFRLVPEERRAWHAGVACWAGVEDVNARSIGVEIVNPGHEWGYRDFPAVQVQSVLDLVADLATRHGIAPSSVVGHSDVAPNRKDDPGEKFPWARLAEEGLALAPWSGDAVDPVPDGFAALALLEEIGYGVTRFGPSACLSAFQRRFAPRLLGQSLSPETRAAIAEVHAAAMALNR